MPLSSVWLWPAKTFARGDDGFTWWLATNWSPDVWTKSGDRYGTCLYYPGNLWKGRDVVGGIRAKVLRNAMQAIEYAYLLDKKRGAGTAMGIINGVLGTTPAYWWDETQGPPRSGSDAAAIANTQIRNPLTWTEVRRQLAQVLVNGK